MEFNNINIAKLYQYKIFSRNIIGIIGINIDKNISYTASYFLFISYQIQ